MKQHSWGGGGTDSSMWGALSPEPCFMLPWGPLLLLNRTFLCIILMLSFPLYLFFDSMRCLGERDGFLHLSQKSGNLFSWLPTKCFLRSYWLESGHIPIPGPITVSEELVFCQLVYTNQAHFAAAYCSTTGLDIGRREDGNGEWMHCIHSKTFLVKVYPSLCSELQTLLPIQTLLSLPYYLLYQLHCLPNFY